MADRTLKTLFESVRKGYNGKQDVTVKLTLESYNGNRYALWATYQEGSSKPDKSTSIREAELSGFIAALQKARGEWQIPDESYSGYLSHSEYAALLDWGGRKSSGNAPPVESPTKVGEAGNPKEPS